MNNVITVFKRNTSVILLISLLFSTAFFIFHYRAPYLEKFDLSYVQDHFHHSQWEIPNSPWGIGDDGLYQYAGYELVTGGDPYSNSPEVPTIGKYLYGFSILYLLNPYFIIVPVYLLTVFLFWFLTGYFIQRKNWRLFSTLLFSVSPLFFSQLKTTTLDLFQLCWLLIHVLAVFVLVKKNKIHIVIPTFLAGVSLGLFIGTKFGAFAVFVLLADLYLLYKNHRLWTLFPILTTCFLVYLGSYWGHFHNHGNFITWLKGQKWIFNFYSQNQPRVFPFSVFVPYLFGTETSLKFVKEWTILWPLSAISVVHFIFLWTSGKLVDERVKYFLIFISSFFLFLAFNNYWVRYFLLPLPLLIIILTKELASQKKLISIGVLVLTLLSAFYFLFFNLADTKKEITYAWENGIYQDLYNYLPSGFQQQYSRAAFDKTLSLVDLNLYYPKKNITFSRDNHDVTINNNTYLGKLTVKQPITFLEENGRWKIKWDWDYVSPGFTPGDEIKIRWETHPDGTFVSGDGVNLNAWGELPFIKVTPQKIDDEGREQLLEKLTRMVEISKEDLRLRLYVQGRKNLAVPLGFMNNEGTFFSHPAIQVEKRLIRYSCVLPVCANKKASAYGQIGGDLVMIKPNGEQTVLLHRYLGY